MFIYNTNNNNNNRYINYLSDEPSFSLASSTLEVGDKPSTTTTTTTKTFSLTKNNQKFLKNLGYRLKNE